MQYMKQILGLCLGFMLMNSQTLTAQDPQLIDQILAVVGEDIILQSDVQNQYNYLIINGQKDDGSLECQVLESLIIQKLLLNKARQDSIEVSDAEVEGELDRRIDVLQQQLGDENEFRKLYGKSISQFRADIRGDILNEILTQRMQGQLESDISITPREVKKFFDNIPEDSLGLFPAEVQLNHIVIKPPFSDESREKAKERLNGWRKEAIEEGADFNALSKEHSDEPAARQTGGDLGWFGRGQMVPTFEEVVYQMRVGEISEPFETEFGLHVVKLEERRGELVHASHILKRLTVASNGDSIAIDSLNQILALIELDSLTFEQAAILYSQDRISSRCGGCISNPQTQELNLPMDALDPDMYFKVDEMKPGEISEPMTMYQPDGTQAFHVLYLRKKVPPHKPNLTDDYQKIRDAALLAKRSENFDTWLTSAKKNIFINIRPNKCSNVLTNWLVE